MNFVLLEWLFHDLCFVLLFIPVQKLPKMCLPRYEIPQNTVQILYFDPVGFVVMLHHIPCVVAGKYVQEHCLLYINREAEIKI